MKLDIARHESLLHAFSRFIPFVETLRIMPGVHWTKPMGTEKWSVSEVVAHILLWDRYFLDTAIIKIATGEPLTVQHLDFDVFNNDAAPYAAAVEQKQLINEAIDCRTEILRLIGRIPATEMELEYTDGDGNPFTILGYLESFVDHDAQHRREIEAFLDKL